jgi:4-amino-4-deoxy-L-arabinose transferase-like glycosyltransferase
MTAAVSSGARREWPSLSVAWAVFVTALALRLLYVVMVPVPVSFDGREYDGLGWRLAEGRGYVDAAGRPTAFWPPVFPLLLGLLYRLAGHDVMAVKIAQAVIGAAVCLLSYVIARGLFNERVAKLTGYACALYPPLIISSGEIMTETLFTFLTALSLWLAMTCVGRGAALLQGGVTGLALLTRPFLLFWLPFLGLWIALRHKQRAPAMLAAVYGAILLVMLPWAWRNAEQLGAFVPLANVGGRTLYNSYFIPERGWGFNSYTEVGSDYFALDETAQSRYLMRQALSYVAEHPEMALALAAKKALFFIYPFDGYWYPVSLGSKFNVFWGLLASFAAVGLVLHFPKRDPNALLFYLFFLSYAVGILIFYGSPRFRLPLEPLLMGFGAAAALRLCARHRTAFTLILLGNLGAFLLFRSTQVAPFFDWLKAWL